LNFVAGRVSARVAVNCRRARRKCGKHSDPSDQKCLYASDFVLSETGLGVV